MAEIFVSYSWDNPTQEERVMSFTNFLRKNGFDAIMDKMLSQNESSIDFVKMMHESLQMHKKVIIVLTEGYKRKAESFNGGVGKEYSIIIKEIDEKPQKYILVSFDGIREDIIPQGLKGREIVNLENKDNTTILFSKLMGKPLYEFTPVSASKPQIDSKKIPDLFFDDDSKKKISDDNGGKQFALKKLFIRTGVIAVIVSTGLVGAKFYFGNGKEKTKSTPLGTGLKNDTSANVGKHSVNNTSHLPEKKDSGSQQNFKPTPPKVSEIGTTTVNINSTNRPTNFRETDKSTVADLDSSIARVFRDKLSEETVRSEVCLKKLTKNYDFNNSLKIKYYEKKEDNGILWPVLKNMGYAASQLYNLKSTNFWAKHRTNAISVGSKVPLKDLQIIALTMIKSGFYIQAIGYFRVDKGKEHEVQITGRAYLDGSPLENEPTDVLRFYRATTVNELINQEPGPAR